MKTSLIIARKEFQSVFRNRLFLTITLLFLGMSILSVYIGSATARAEMRLYAETIESFKAQGRTALPEPPNIQTLTILANISEYVSIIGAILAIMLGYNSLIEEKESGSLKLLLSRPVYRDRLLAGKLLGGAAVIGLLLALVFLFNLFLLVVVSGIWPSLADVGRLFLFILLAFVYMLIFLTGSTLLSVRLHNAPQVFLIALVVWMIFSFVIPQMADTQMVNSTVINSITGVASQIPEETALSRAIKYLSPTWHLRSTGGQLLEATSQTIALHGGALLAQSGATLVALLTPVIVFTALAYAFFLRDETVVLE
jgi:ABC-2 type transport system permease protein